MSTAIVRFFTSGLRDADARLERMLAPRPSGAADHYLASSVAIATIDRLLRRCSAVWAASVTYRALLSVAGDSTWRQRYEFLGGALIVGAVTHVAILVAQGPRPGWYWVAFPAVAIGFGLLLVTASKSASRL